MEVTGPVGFLLPKACEDGGVLVFTFYHAMLEKAMENASASFPPFEGRGMCPHPVWRRGDGGPHHRTDEAECPFSCGLMREPPAALTHPLAGFLSCRGPAEVGGHLSEGRCLTSAREAGTSARPRGRPEGVWAPHASRNT